jgi:hypothetical protein
MEWEIQIWERGRWGLYALVGSFSQALWWQEDLEYIQGIPARLVPNDSAPGWKTARAGVIEFG